jgi:hypothetical protein
MEASMRMRLDLIDDLLQQRSSLRDTAPVKSDMMQEFEVILTQMPYVGGSESLAANKQLEVRANHVRFWRKANIPLHFAL